MARLHLIVLCSLVLAVAGNVEHPCDESCHDEQTQCDLKDPPPKSDCDCYTCKCSTGKDALTFIYCCIETSNTAPLSVPADCKAVVDTDGCFWKTVKKKNQMWNALLRQGTTVDFDEECGV